MNGPPPQPLPRQPAVSQRREIAHFRGSYSTLGESVTAEAGCQWQLITSAPFSPKKSTGGFMICEDFRTFRNGWHVQYVCSARAHKNNLRFKLRPHNFCFAFQNRARALASAKKNLRPQKNANARARAKKSPTDAEGFKVVID